MDLMKCYLSTSRIALQANCMDPSSWQEMHTLLPSLHERLSCRACRRLPADRPPGACGLDRFACSACSGGHHPADQTAGGKAALSRGSIARCYRKLCAFIQQSPLYDVMCARQEDSRLVELLTEVIDGASSGATADGRDRPAPSDDRPGIETTDGRSDADDDAVEPAAAAAAVVLRTPAVRDERVNVQVLNGQSHHGNGVHGQPGTLHEDLPRKKKNERGCRCGNATSTPGKLTCFGQRCPCYTRQKPCDRCKCRGCRNPRQKRSSNGDSMVIDKLRRKPVTLELVSSLKPSHFTNKPMFSSYTMHDVLQFPAHGQNYDQNGTEVTLGHVNSIFHSP